MADKKHERFMRDVYENSEMDISPAEMGMTEPTTVKFGSVINTKYVRVRSRANLQSKVIKTLSDGNLVRVIGEENNFYKILINLNGNDEIGYIYSKYIHIEEVSEEI